MMLATITFHFIHIQQSAREMSLAVRAIMKEDHLLRVVVAAFLHSSIFDNGFTSLVVIAVLFTLKDKHFNIISFEQCLTFTFYLHFFFFFL